MEGTKMLGTVETVHLMEGRYGGSYGTIIPDDEPDTRRYVWCDGNVFRDMTHMKVGLRVSFVVVSYGYATDISCRGVDQTPRT